MKRRLPKGKRTTTSVVPVDPHEKIIMRLPCYEPSGHSIEISETCILRHMLLIGGTGFGKSSCLSVMLSELIGYRANEPEKRPGIVVMDNQCDDTSAKIRFLARKVGREADIVHLSPANGWYRPLGEVRSWIELSRAISRLTSASEFIDGKNGRDNRYWAETTKMLLETSLVILLATTDHVEFSKVLEFTGDWLIAGSESGAISRRIRLFFELAGKAASSVSSIVRTKLGFAEATINMWRTLDPRTKAILRSCIGSAIAPFTSIAALRYWDQQRGNVVNPAQAFDGKIVIVSVQAATDPELATILGRMAKMDFYEAAQTRRYRPGDRIAVLIQDEFPYSVSAGSSRWSDVTNLATLRAKGAALIAATQGLVNLEVAGVGPRVVDALRVNFSSVVFFRSQELAVDLWAERIFGLKTRRKKAPENPHQSYWPTNPVEEFFADLQGGRAICPRGTLSKLQPHQAFISLADGYRTHEPVWLAANHLDLTPEVEPPDSDDPDMEIITEIRRELSQDADSPEEEKPIQEPQ